MISYMGAGRFAVSGDGLAPRYQHGTIIRVGEELLRDAAAASGREVVCRAGGAWFVGRVARRGAGWSVLHPWQDRDLAGAPDKVMTVAAIVPVAESEGRQALARLTGLSPSPMLA